MLSINYSQNINYYLKDNESFADVSTENFTFTCRVAGMENEKETLILLMDFLKHPVCGLV